MNKTAKIVDAEALAGFIDGQRDTDGNVRTIDVLQWLISANNHIDHGHGHFIDSVFSIKTEGLPDLIGMLVDRDKYLLFQGNRFIEKIEEFTKSENGAGQP